MKVPILRLPITEEDAQVLGERFKSVLLSGSLTMGPQTRRFEEMFAQFSGAKHAISNASGTASLELIIRALGIQQRSIIVPTNTFAATAYAVVNTKNRVIFADSDPNTLCLDPEDVARRIEDDTAAVILVHIGGVITPAVEKLKRLCEERNLALIEDCAHAHGCSLNGAPAGTIGCAGAFSFFPTKTLTTGEGGMVVTNSDEIAEKVKIFRNHGKNPALRNKMSEPGNNYRISELTAAFGVWQMEKAEGWISQRQEIAAFYDQNIAGVAGVQPLKLPKGMVSSYYKYIAFLDEDLDRDRLKKLMQERYEVSLTGEVYADLCHTEPVWQGYTYCGMHRDGGTAVRHGWEGCTCDHPAGDFPGAAFVARRHICLPLYPDMTVEECRHVLDSLSKSIQEIRGNT
ncbi:DegT/DnrJ/EryC1/StrS family aminotransferase [Aquabacterium sp. A7-Y]|uniref:DegT/DnrJ/EryC1/StrS family aminotransferase n=1 Tax=Aquabacterium sp. A7-Y TaxID=1349605 RepID=UPI00223E696A|nr:DegT/DnrJ/EryC1/StrS family aminotransferase [Aquabacterium sp. A7-Y]MCW7536787.1 DegT/DnrJ/EryC1/StrS family aminotransferase [Aquabacterium sp. A7-Y]